METQEKFLLGALIGGAIGISAALMLTPFTGDKLRKKIINGLNHSIKETHPKKVVRGVKKTLPKVVQKTPRAKAKAHSKAVHHHTKAAHHHAKAAHHH